MFARRGVSFFVGVIIAVAIAVPVGLALGSISEEPGVDGVSLSEEGAQLRREGLTKILSGMESWGDEADPEAIAEIQQQLEPLGGPDPEVKAETDALLENAVTPEGYRRMAEELHSK